MTETSPDLRAFAEEHLVYEVDMVTGLVQRLTRHASLFSTWDGHANPLMREIEDMVGRNADIESFGLHTRILVDFLYDQRAKPTDAVARDYFDEPLVWRHARPKKPRELRDVNERVGTEIAHLSYLRSAPAKEWPYPKIWTALCGVLRTFIEHVDPERVGEDILERMRNAVDPPLTDPKLVRAHTALSWTLDSVQIIEPSAATATASLRAEFPPLGDWAN